MLIVKNLTVLFLLLFVSSLLVQTNASLQTFSIPEGLSSPNVEYVCQYRFGYIRVISDDGLNRFDGKNIKIFHNDPDNPN